MTSEIMTDYGFHNSFFRGDTRAYAVCVSFSYYAVFVALACLNFDLLFNSASFYPASSRSYLLFPLTTPSSGAANPRRTADPTARQPGDLQPSGHHRTTPTQIPPSNRTAHPTAAILEGECSGCWGGRHHQLAPPL